MSAARLYTCTRCDGAGERLHDGKPCRACGGSGTTSARPYGLVPQERERKPVSERAVSELNGPRPL